jgi:hypothetical protein
MTRAHAGARVEPGVGGLTLRGSRRGEKADQAEAQGCCEDTTQWTGLPSPATCRSHSDAGLIIAPAVEVANRIQRRECSGFRPLR